MIKSAPAAQVRSLAILGDYEEAAALLVGAAADGDPEAGFLLALWRIDGAIIRRDLQLARFWLRQAAENGHVDAARMHACFLAAGTGGPSDWAGAKRRMQDIAPVDDRAAEQLRIIRACGLGTEGLPSATLESTLLSKQPFVRLFPGFASAGECDYLVAAAEAEFRPSAVVDPVSGRLVPHPIRRSEGAFFGVMREDLVVNALNRRIAAVTGTDQAQGEALQLLRYRPGMEYREHLDTLPAEPNQRIATVIVYLSDGYAGGETAFPAAGLAVKGRKGDALFFSNILSDGRPDPAARHAGLPVRRGVKLVASRWIRARPFVYPLPRPLTGSRFD